jgi:hypothetical protein
VRPAVLNEPPVEPLLIANRRRRAYGALASAAHCAGKAAARSTPLNARTSYSAIPWMRKNPRQECLRAPRGPRNAPEARPLAIRQQRRSCPTLHLRSASRGGWRGEPELRQQGGCTASSQRGRRAIKQPPRRAKPQLTRSRTTFLGKTAAPCCTAACTRWTCSRVPALARDRSGRRLHPSPSSMCRRW